MTNEERVYRPYPNDPAQLGAYLLFPEADGWRWLWREPDEPDEIGPLSASRAAALRSIARDWEGAGGEPLPKFVGMLRGLARKEEARM